MNLSKHIFTTLIALSFLGTVNGQIHSPSDNPTDTVIVVNAKTIFLDRFSFKAYGVVNYYAYDWESLPDKRNAFDAERLVLYLNYDFNNKIEFNSEIEFEHGGTGASMGFDPIQEFGEFEQEISKGGEVNVEQLNLLFKIDPRFKIRIGKLKLYTGNAAKLDEPIDYFTTYRSRVENTLLPYGWYEIGIELSGDFQLKNHAEYPKLSYKANVVSGLDNSAFSSLNWIRPGYQKRFETINADNLAYAFRLDYIFGEESEIGFNVYAGNATGNRPKKDFTEPSWVLFGDVHFSLDAFPWRVRAYGMLGNITNSEDLSEANRNLSNHLGVKRTPVGAAAAGTYGEVAYDFLHLFNPAAKQRLYAFGRAEWFDSMYATQGNVSDIPRYEKTIFVAGLNYFPIPNIVLKANYEWRALGDAFQDNTFSAGFGFNF